MNVADATDAVRDVMLPLWQQERKRLDFIDSWYRWEHPHPPLPPSATTELKKLVELSKTPWLGLVVTTVAQQLYVDGFTSPTMPDPNPLWDVWRLNQLNSRQTAIHRSALAYGVAYETVLRGEDGHALMRGVSPRKMVTMYADPAEDLWPMMALRVDARQVAPGVWADLSVRLYDEEFVYFYQHGDALTTSAKLLGNLTFIERRPHEMGVTPVVRFANQLDLDGRSAGEVEPFVPLAARINKTDYDRMLVQHFSSWKVRTISGLAKPATDEEANRQKLKLSIDTLLVAEDSDTKFGILPETDMRPFIEAHKSDIAALAAVSQTPTHTLTGDLINLSAEALEESRAGLMAKVTERKSVFGESHEQALRLAALVEGEPDIVNDPQARVTWQDTSVRSLAQAVDALGKAAQMLQIPPQALWGKIPGVTKDEVDEWEAEAQSQLALQLFSQIATAQKGAPGQDSGANGANPAGQ